MEIIVLLLVCTVCYSSMRNFQSRRQWAKIESNILQYNRLYTIKHVICKLANNKYILKSQINQIAATNHFYVFKRKVRLLLYA